MPTENALGVHEAAKKQRTPKFRKISEIFFKKPIAKAKSLWYNSRVAINRTL